jgi:hypothetical protein
VDWYATLVDGSEVGWQAKHIHDFDNLLTAMMESVKRVTRERPQLKTLIFVISTNLATGTSGNQRKSQRQKYEDRLASWRATINGASGITFKLIQESDLLERLAEPKHRGRAWFWWDAPVFDQSWLETRFAEQSEAAGDRYQPELQVDLPIQEDLTALGFAESTVTHFEGLRRQVISAGRDLRLTPIGSKSLQKLYRSIQVSAKALIDLCGSLALKTPSDLDALKPLRFALDRYIVAVHDAKSMEIKLNRIWRDNSSDDPDPEKKKPPVEASGYRVLDLYNRASTLNSWLDSTESQAMQKGLYFLQGPTGSGKTHLFIDATRRVLDHKRPAVVLFGARFGTGNLWESISDQLGLPPIGRDVLLGAMDSAGEAATLNGCRFVIFIDALNETVPPNFWTSHLPSLRAAIHRWPHIALAVSCRDTYIDVVDENRERGKYVLCSHPGFAGREVDATQMYFAHFGLEAPRIPLLVPEFTLPLFLRLYCESLQDSNQQIAAVGHEGRVKIFERFLNTKLNRVARRLRPGAASDYEVENSKRHIRIVLDALLDELVSTGKESMTMARAEEITAAAVVGSTGNSETILGVLQDEGVLIREFVYLENGQSIEGLRIVFQAFADFLLLKRMIDKTVDPMQNPNFRGWFTEKASWGIIEAAAVVFPERYKVELPDFLKPSNESSVEGNEGYAAARRHHGRALTAYRSMIKTLPYRDATSISDRTVELLNQGQQYLSYDDLFRVFFQIAPQPGNRLNANALHNYLLQFKMPRRDATFGIATYREISDETGPITRLTRWASDGPYPDYESQVVELACVPLIWLLSSPNRYMRDWVTKSLVQLLRGHLDVMLRLLNRFWEVDDPYVVQRVVVIAYGSLMRSEPSARLDVKKLAARVRKLVFTRPVRADELLLDAARGIVELGVQRGLLPKVALEEIKRPYGIKPPSNPPSEEALETKYGYVENQPIEKSYGSICLSVLGTGDFGRHVVESGMHYFSRYQYGQDFPPREWPAAARFVKARWNQFESSLTQKQRIVLRRLQDKTADNSQPNELNFRLSSLYDTLTVKQQVLFSKCWVHPRQKGRHDDYSVDRAQRWVFRRTLNLGWTPKFFGNTDWMLSHGHGSHSHRAERWGEKYQWMAYHELLARVADNYQPSRRFDYEQGYEGLHQMLARREIDPSLPPIPYRDFVEHSGESVQTWPTSPVRLLHWPPGKVEFSRYAGSVNALLDDRDSEPTLETTAFVVDENGVSWVLLDAWIQQGDPEAEEFRLGLQQDFNLNTWFVPQAQAADLVIKLATVGSVNHSDLLDSQGHVDCCYFGEIGLTSHECFYAQRAFRGIESDDRTWQLVQTFEAYSWEGSILDCSIDETVLVSAPAFFVRSRADLIGDDCGPSWRDSDGRIVFTNLSDRSGRIRMFMVRADWLQKFLSTNALELIASIWYRRLCLDDDHSYRHHSEDVYGSARVDASLRMHLSDVIRERYPV